MLPMIQGGLWVMLLFAAYYFASRMVRSFGKGLRHAKISQRRFACIAMRSFIFLAGIVLTFFGGIPPYDRCGFCRHVRCGIHHGGYASLHHRSKVKDWRLPVLVLAYLSAVFMFPLFFILLLGLSDVRSTISLTPARNSDQTNETNSIEKGSEDASHSSRAHRKAWPDGRNRKGSRWLRT